jgi:hypothetical protein
MSGFGGRHRRWTDGRDGRKRAQSARDRAGIRSTSTNSRSAKDAHLSRLVFSDILEDLRALHGAIRDSDGDQVYRRLSRLDPALANPDEDED